MTSVEDRTRAAMDAITGQVHTAPPLRLPPSATAVRRSLARSPRRRWGPRLAPAAAAAVMIAVAIVLVVVRNAPAGRSASPASAASVSGVPEYYVALPGYNTNGAGAFANPSAGVSEAIVGDTFTGDRLAVVSAPAGWKFVSVAAAGDDRTFVVGAYKTAQRVDRTATNWFLIRLTPGSAPRATLRELPIHTPTASGLAVSMALSPDGSEFALSGHPLSTHVSVWVYSTASGALLHTWSLAQGADNVLVPADVLSWTSDGRQLAFQVTTLGPGPGQERVSIRLLQTDDPGHDLLADSRAIWSMAVPATITPDAKRPFACGGSVTTANPGTSSPYPSILISGDGATLVCGASGVFREPGSLGDSTCPAVPPWNYQGVLEYSAATGKLIGTLYRGDSNCVPVPSPVQLLWVSGSGGAVLGYFEFDGYGESQSVYRFGLFKARTFTQLPEPPTIATDPAGAAW